MLSGRKSFIVVAIILFLYICLHVALVSLTSKTWVRVDHGPKETHAKIGTNVYLKPNEQSRIEGRIETNGSAVVSYAEIRTNGKDPNDEDYELYEVWWHAVLPFDGWVKGDDLALIDEDYLRRR